MAGGCVSGSSTTTTHPSACSVSFRLPSRVETHSGQPLSAKTCMDTFSAPETAALASVRARSVARSIGKMGGGVKGAGDKQKRRRMQ